MAAEVTDDEADALERRLTQLTALFDELVPLLEAERDALRRNSGADLADATAAKLRVCGSIETLLDGAGSLGDTVRSAGSTRLEALHEQLLGRARHAREYNLVNGKVVARAQQSVKELQQLLHGDHADGIYGRAGTPQNDNPGRPLAKA